MEYSSENGESDIRNNLKVIDKQNIFYFKLLKGIICNAFFCGKE